MTKLAWPSPLMMALRKCHGMVSKRLVPVWGAWENEISLYRWGGEVIREWLSKNRAKQPQISHGAMEGSHVTSPVPGQGRGKTADSPQNLLKNFLMEAE